MHLNEFIIWLRDTRKACVIELGTRRSNPNFATHHQEWVSPDCKFVMSDFQDGLDVDVLADAHTLTQTFEPESFDALIACSVFEHIQRPWIAATEIAKILKPGGKAYIQTHQTFPLHAYPYDYWRYTKEAMETIFGDAGLSGQAYYEFPCKIISEVDPNGANHPAFLNVCIVAEKPGNRENEGE